MSEGGLPLGQGAGTPPAFGFAQADSGGSDCLIRYAGDGHVLVTAPTGAGKGRDLLIPLLLAYDGPVVVIDPKGEAYAITARRRRQLGQEVAVLDPFGITGAASDALNPLDLFDLPGSLLDCDAEMLASLLATGHDFTTDVFWNDTAGGLIAGLIAHIIFNESREKRHLTTLRSFLCDHDVDYEVAKLLDAMVSKPPGDRPQFAYEELAAFLNHPAERTRPSVLSTAVTYVKGLGTAPVAKTLERSTIRLADIIAGQPLSLFIVVPPAKFKSHRALLRLWVGVLLTAIMGRKSIPARNTLFICDESAQLGKEFEPLLTAATLLRGYGLQLVTVWQDLSQLKSRFPLDWPTILNNSGVLHAFGFANYGMAREWADVLGVEPHTLLKLHADEAALFIRGEGIRTIRRLNYLQSPHFAGLFDPNPYFARTHSREAGNPGR